MRLFFTFQVHPEVEGELLSAQYKPDDVAEPMQLCNVTPGMRVRAVNLRALRLKNQLTAGRLVQKYKY